MKRFMLTALYLIATAYLFGEPFFLHPELKTYGNFAFAEGKNPTFVGATGVFAKNENLELSSILPFKKNDFSAIKDYACQKDFCSLFSEPRSALSIKLFKESVPLNFAVGNLGITRSISRLKNPVANLPSSPFTRNFYFSSGISPYLPSLNSAKKPLSLFFEADFSKTKVPFILQGAFDKEKNAFFSSGTRFNFSKHVYIQSNITFAGFYLENNSSYLTKHKLNFERDFYYATSFESNFSSPYFKVNSFIGLHQSPYDKNSMWFYLKERSFFGPFLLDAGYFLIPTAKDFPEQVPLITASSSIVKTCEQFFVNPQFLILNEKSSVKLGAIFCQTRKIAGTSKIYEIKPIKASGGFLYEKERFSLSQIFSVSNIVIFKPKMEKANVPQKFYEVSLDVSKNRKYCKTIIKSSCKFYQEDDFNHEERQVYSFSAKSYFGKSKNLSVFSSYSATCKGSEKERAALSAGGSLKIEKKYCSTYLKCSFNLKV